MSYPRGTIVRNTTAARINHWITAACFRLADAVGPVDVPPAPVLSLRAIRQRAMGARDPSLDRLRAARELRRAHRAVLARQFLELGRHRLDGARSSAYSATRRKAFPRLGGSTPGRNSSSGRWRSSCPRSSSPASSIWEYYFGAGDEHRDAARRGAHSQLRGDRGDHHLDHPCLRGDLGERLDAGYDPGLCDPRLGVAPPPQMAAKPRRDRLAWASSASRGREFMRQGETAPKGSWIGNAIGRRQSAGADRPSRSRPALFPHRRAARTAGGRPCGRRLACLHGRGVTRAGRRRGLLLDASRPRRSRHRSGGRRAHSAHRGRRASPRCGLARWSCRCCSKASTRRCFPPSAAAAIADLRRRDAPETETLADAFLRGGVDPPTPARFSGSPRRCRSISPGSPQRCGPLTSGCLNGATSAPAAARPRRRA